MTPRIAIRADSSASIGSGHLMRSLTLAEALRGRGAVVKFVCRRLPGAVGSLAEQSGFPVRWLRAPSTPREACWFGGVDGAEDARETAAVLESAAPYAWLVTDHYGVDSRWERRLRPLTGRILAVDDLHNRTRDCDVLLDHNLYDDAERRYQMRVPEACKRLIGPEYALLRPAFAAVRPAALRDRSQAVRRILVFFGGTDPSSEAIKTLRALSILGRDDIHVDLICGLANPRAEEIRATCGRRPNTAFYRHVPEMAELMSRADLAVGAGGVTTWERCCLGLPAVTIAVAKNQERASRLLAGRGCAVYLGRASEIDAARIAQSLDELCSAPETLARISRNAAALVDGRGVERVVDAMQAAGGRESVAL